jgi:hypothetical protein
MFSYLSQQTTFVFENRINGLVLAQKRVQWQASSSSSVTRPPGFLTRVLLFYTFSYSRNVWLFIFIYRYASIAIPETFAENLFSGIFNARRKAKRI